MTASFEFLSYAFVSFGTKTLTLILSKNLMGVKIYMYLMGFRFSVLNVRAIKINYTNSLWSMFIVIY